MLLGGIDANGIVLIIGAIGIVAMQVVNAVLGYFREQRKISADAEALAATKHIAAQTQAVAIAVDSSAEKIHDIAKQTDGMNKALVDAAIIQGASEERTRADTAKADAILAQADLLKPPVVPMQAESKPLA